MDINNDPIDIDLEVAVAMETTRCCAGIGIMPLKCAAMNNNLYTIHK